MDLGIEGRVALVCAASRGIGFGIARALAADGARVAISSRSRERIDAAAAALGARGYVHDTHDLDGVDALFEAVERDLGPVAILVTNTGGPPTRPDPLGFSTAEWEAAHRELQLAPIAMIRRALPAMRDAGFGRVLNVSSSVIYEPIPALVLSTAHRTGMLGAFKLIADEVAADGVTVNTIVPGRIATDRLADTHGSLEAAERAARETIPARRLGTIDEMGAVGAFLCSARASYVTGTAVVVDGGLLRSL